MEIVKIKTNKRVLYAIRISKGNWFFKPKYSSLYNANYTWRSEKEVLEFCCHESLATVERVYHFRTNTEHVIKVIERCKCKPNTK